MNQTTVAHHNKYCNAKRMDSIGPKAPMPRCLSTPQVPGSNFRRAAWVPMWSSAYVPITVGCARPRTEPPEHAGAVPRPRRDHLVAFDRRVRSEARECRGSQRRHRSACGVSPYLSTCADNVAPSRACSEVRVAGTADSGEPRARLGGRLERSKPVRVTVDLVPDDYDALREFAYLARMSHADVLRSLIRVLMSDEKVAQRVRSSVNRSR